MIDRLVRLLEAPLVIDDPFEPPASAEGASTRMTGEREARAIVVLRSRAVAP